MPTPPPTNEPPHFDRFAAVPGVEVWSPDSPSSFAVSIGADGAAPVYTTADEAAWATQCAANPRLHDGPILAVERLGASPPVVYARRDRYKHLALRLGEVRLLGVKGWVTARDADGGEHLLIARRGAETRVYAGLWESAPAGGVDPPHPSLADLDIPDLAEVLEVEGDEELGLDLDTRSARVVGLCRDLIASSDDLYLGIVFPGPIDPRRSPSCQHAQCAWEYSDTAWLARSDAGEFDGRTPSPLSPPTRAMLRLLGWIA